MGDAKLGIGTDQRLVQHLFLLVAHVRDQQREEGHELLDLPRQHGVHFAVVQLVNELHFRRNGVADLHDVDAVRRTRRDLDELSADLFAGAAEFVSLDRGEDKALDAAHPHPQGQKLHGEGFAGAAGAQQVQIRVLVLFGVEEIHDAERIVVPVDAQQYARVVGHLKACEHVRGGSAGGEYIPSGLALQPGVDLQEGHDRGKSRLLLEAAIADVHIHGFEHVHHLLLAPHQLINAFSGDGDEHREVKQILVIVGDALLNVVAGLDGVGELLIVCTGVLHAFELGAVEADALGHLVDGLAAVFPVQVDVDVDALAGVNERGHPASPHSAGITVPTDIQEAVIQAVHDHIAVMAEVQTAGRDEVRHADMGNGIQTDDPVPGGHGIHYNPVDPGRKGIIHTGAAVEEHIQDLCRGLVRILGLDNRVAALHEVGAGVLLHGLDHAVDLTEILAVSVSQLFKLIDQEEAPGQSLPVAHIADKADIALALAAAFLVFLLLQLLTEKLNMLVRIRLAGEALELQPLRRDLQPGGKRRDDVVLLFVGAQHEVDGLDLQDPDILSIRCLDDPMVDFLHGNIILDELKQLAAVFWLSLFWGF